MNTTPGPSNTNQGTNRSVRGTTRLMTRSWMAPRTRKVRTRAGPGGRNRLRASRRIGPGSSPRSGSSDARSRRSNRSQRPGEHAGQRARCSEWYAVAPLDVSREGGRHTLHPMAHPSPTTTTTLPRLPPRSTYRCASAIWSRVKVRSITARMARLATSSRTVCSSSIRSRRRVLVVTNLPSSASTLATFLAVVFPAASNITS